jgi:ribosomal protein L35
VVVLQASTAGSKRWITFRKATANGKAVFHAAYRFHSTTRRTHYRFRALVPRQAGYPWVQGHSKPAEVLVAG